MSAFLTSPFPFKSSLTVNMAKSAIDSHDKKLIEWGLHPVCYDLAIFKKKSCLSQPPLSNTGVITPTDTHINKTHRALNTKKIEFNGQTLRLPLSISPSGLVSECDSLPESLDLSLDKKQVSSDIGFIDYLSFSFRVNAFEDAFPQSSNFVGSDSFVLSVSERLTEILGYGLTVENNYGRFNYSKSWELGNGYGVFMTGGNNDTAFVSLTGAGLMAALDGFEIPLYSFLFNINASITRIDVAHDIFDGFGYSVDRCRSDYKAGLFHVRGIRPTARALGNWDYIDNKGRSYYVGSRAGGKMLRVYEKGLQIGGAVAGVYKDWLRIEVEFRKNSARPVLPLDMLLFPSQYLAGAYPALNFLSDDQKRIITTKVGVKCTVETIKKFVKVQAANSLSFIYRCLFDSDDNAFIQYLKHDVFKSEDDFPKKILDAIPSLRSKLPDFVPSVPVFNPAFLIPIDGEFDGGDYVPFDTSSYSAFLPWLLSLCPFDKTLFYNGVW